MLWPVNLQHLYCEQCAPKWPSYLENRETFPFPVKFGGMESIASGNFAQESTIASCCLKALYFQHKNLAQCSKHYRQTSYKQFSRPALKRSSKQHIARGEKGLQVFYIFFDNSYLLFPQSQLAPCHSDSNKLLRELFFEPFSAILFSFLTIHQLAWQLKLLHLQLPPLGPHTGTMSEGDDNKAAPQPLKQISTLGVTHLHLFLRCKVWKREIFCLTMISI